MRRILASFAALLAVFMISFIVPATAHGVDILGQNPGTSPCNNSNATGTPSVCGDANPTTNPLVGPNGVITKATQILAIVVGVAAVIMIIIAGFRMIVSSGDPQAIKTARSTMVYALIGLAVAALAQTIVTFVIGKA